MFELGPTLRQARERRGLTYAEVERETRIRPRYLRALEEETWDALPGPTYTKGFLRAYADFLDLDGQQFVDEFSSRLPPPEEGPTVSLQPIARPRLWAPTGALAGVVLVLAVVAVAVWLVGVGGGSKQAGRHAPPHHATRPPAPPPPAPPPKPTTARLTLTAVRGACWYDAHRGSQTGSEVSTGTLEPGQSVRLSGRRLWLRLGDPTTVDATLNGTKVALPQLTPVNVLVTASGIQQTS